MNLLLFLGAKLFGLGAFKVIFTVILVGAIVILLTQMATLPESAGAIFIDLAIYAIYFIVMFCLGFPVLGIIWTFPFLHLVFAIMQVCLGLVPVYMIAYIIGDVIGLVLFYKHLL